jgi:predicted HTH transcriptional regulator
VIKGKYCFYENEDNSRKQILGSIKNYCEPPLEPVIDRVEIERKPLLTVKVEVVAGNNKPYVINNRGIYIRHNERDDHISRRELDEM